MLPRQAPYSSSIPFSSRCCHCFSRYAFRPIAAARHAFLPRRRLSQARLRVFAKVRFSAALSMVYIFRQEGYLRLSLRYITHQSPSDHFTEVDLCFFTGSRLPPSSAQAASSLLIFFFMSFLSFSIFFFIFRLSFADAASCLRHAAMPPLIRLSLTATIFQR